MKLCRLGESRRAKLSTLRKERRKMHLLIVNLDISQEDKDKLFKQLKKVQQ